MRRACVVFAVLLTALLTAPTEAREKKKTVPSAAARTLLENQGFAVEDGHASRLSSAYRWATGPVFVTADAGLATYLLCLRKLLIQRAGHWNDRAGPLLADWQEALGKSAPDGEREAARLFVALLRRLQGDPSSDEGLTETHVEILDRELERLEAGDPVARVPGLGLPLDRRPVASLWQSGWLGGPERWQVLVYLLTRGRGDRAVRDRLQGTMPRRIEILLGEYVDGVGSARLDFPGREGVFDFQLHAGTRFPPGVLDEHPDLLGLDLGARLGNVWAAAELAGREPSKQLLPVPVEPPADSLRARLLGVLRELPGKPEGAPALFTAEPWQRLELQAVLGAQVLWRRAVGVASAPSKVFGAGEHPGFVHPDPDFWRSLSVLARLTADDARHDDVRVWLPPLKELVALEVLVRRRMAEESPFMPKEKARLRACGFGGGWRGFFEEWGTPRHLEDADSKAFMKKGMERELLDPRYGLPGMQARRADPPKPWWIGALGTLSEHCEALALLADHQLRGEALPKAGHILEQWGFFLEDVDGAFREDPTVACVEGLIDGDRSLFTGVAAMDRLWVLYPWGEEAVLCRGSVFAYRELVSTLFVHEDDWRRRVRSAEPPPRPAWAEVFVAR